MKNKIEKIKISKTIELFDISVPRIDGSILQNIFMEYNNFFDTFFVDKLYFCAPIINNDTKNTNHIHVFSGSA